MIQTLCETQFLEHVRQHSRWKQFSYEAWQLIYEWETEINPKVEYDPIGFCCDYSEYESFKDLQAEHEVETLDDLRGKTWVGDLPEGRLLIRNY